jgi:hypothetical protein
MRMKITGAAAVLTAGVLLLAQSVGAHNSNSVHPRITAASGDAIRAGDTDGHYSEMYFDLVPGVRPQYWGRDFIFSQELGDADADVGYAAYNSTPLNTVDGSVQEDVPEIRVLNHFYHGYNGVPLSPPATFAAAGAAHPSAGEAWRYFDQGVEVFDYAESDSIAQAADGTSVAASSGKSLGFWFLGHALHHVEDMTSPAHVHNDAHITILGTAPDDAFEGQYVPTLFWAIAEPGAPAARRALGLQLLDSMSQPANFRVNRFEDIWPTPNTSGLELSPSGQLFGRSLVRSTYNFAIYHARIETPVFFPEDPPPAPGCPTGELADMLNGDSAGSCLPTDDLHYTGAGSWFIRNVGFYNYSGALPVNSWWPVSPGLEPFAQYRGPPVLEDQGGGAFYYIEDLNEGEARGNHPTNGMLDANLLTPWGRRADFTRPWDPANNRVVRNDRPGTPGVDPQPLTELMALSILPQGAAYVEGLSRLWYDVVNPPPYLKRVVARQGETVCYDGSWKDVAGARNIVLTNKDTVGNFIPAKYVMVDATRTFAYVKRRDLVVTGAPQFINPQLPFEIELEFSEPVQTPTAETFALSFGGTPVSFTNLDVQDMRAGDTTLQRWQTSRKWLVKLSSAPSELNGRVRLGIRASDANWHFTSVGNREWGAVLDSDPRTPARRARVRANQQRVAFNEDRSSWMSYSWHTSSTRDVNYPVADVPAGGFAYDQSPNGDQTHFLLFDSTPPTGTATVTYPPVN